MTSQLENLDTVLIALRSVTAFWTLRAALLAASASLSSGESTLLGVVSSLKKRHRNLWGAVQDLGLQMPGALSTTELEAVERATWI